MLKALLSAAVAGTLVLAGITQAQGVEGDPSPNSGEEATQAQEGTPDGATLSSSQAAAIEEYWTPERMAGANPRTATEVVDDADAGSQEASEAPGPPGGAPGWAPGSGAQPDTSANSELGSGDGALPQHGTKPTNPKDGPYGPFQRWTWFGRYLSYPTSTIGKLFFTIPSGPEAGNYVCSASVIHRSTVMTAGHCNSDGDGVFATNRLFCPSYNAGGVNPERGCWSAVNSKTSSGWHSSGDPDYDYACLIMALQGDTINDKIGNVTGWLGRAWNFSATQMEMQFGYPAGSPFPGFHIIAVASPEWYEHDFRSGDQVSKLTGNDMTGGSSGGPWILGLNHRNAEHPDTDGSNATDPGSQWINGVNSHKRCRTNCSSPPTTGAGVFWQEMSSPPFRNTSASDESEDIVPVCFDNGGT